MELKKPITLESAFAAYTAVEVIGEGGAGTVYRATTDDGNRTVAVKILDPEKASAERRKRFKNELLLGTRARHPNIVSVLDHGVATIRSKTTPFYVMPLYEQSLREDIANNRVRPASVLDGFAHILDGVEAAHLMCVIHRDLKPENILFDPTTKNWIIADFGIAEFSQEELYTLVETKPTARLANFQYAAPEQRMRNGRTDARTDIFALGLILNEMFTGEIAHGTEYKTIAAVAPDLAYLDELVALMIRQNPDNRPSSVEAIKHELIGRRNLFIEYQRLSELKQVVVPASELDDPIAQDPIRIIDFDWTKDTLTLRLNQPVNTDWTQAIQFGAYSKTSLMGRGPERFNFRGDTATIQASFDEVQQVIDFFKSWLPSAQQIYVSNLEQRLRAEDERKRRALAQEIDEREKRREVLKKVKL